MTEPENIELSGDLTVREVPAAWHRFEQRSSRGLFPARVDLAQVERTDSSALALLLEWQAHAGMNRQTIRFDNPPESLRVIARLTEVEELLGWNNHNHNQG